MLRQSHKIWWFSVRLNHHLSVHSAVAAAFSRLFQGAPDRAGRAFGRQHFYSESSFSKAAIFMLTQKTSIACSSSETGGRLGATRMLRSRGSFP